MQRATRGDIRFGSWVLTIGAPAGAPASLAGAAPLVDWYPQSSASYLHDENRLQSKPLGVSASRRSPRPATYRDAGHVVIRVAQPSRFVPSNHRVAQVHDLRHRFASSSLRSVTSDGYRIFVPEEWVSRRHARSAKVSIRLTHARPCRADRRVFGACAGSSVRTGHGVIVTRHTLWHDQDGGGTIALRAECRSGVDQQMTRLSALVLEYPSQRIVVEFNRGTGSPLQPLSV